MISYLPLFERVLEQTMSIDKKEVENIATLARLAIDPKDIDNYTSQLAGIMDFVEQMNAVNTDDVVPMAHPQDVTQRLRTDEVSEADQREKFQKIAPETEAGLYLVPKVIE
jgi:aspartyl-tRNA(Asn)/glutamyl-tRNA(Gln) amidotransferase subunit C